MTPLISRTIVPLVCLATLLAVPLAPARADVKIYQTALRATAWVLAKNSEGTSSGTGVLVDAKRKLVMTNFHVVGDSRVAVLFFPEMKDGQPIVERKHYLTNVKRLGIRGQVVGVDRKRDLALVQLEKLPASAAELPLAASGIGPGEDVESVGNPGSTDALWVYTSGTVRAVYQKKFRTGAGEHEFRVVETQSPINSGDSGGPVVNASGELVAIAQAIAPKARLVSYCVDVSEIKAFLNSPWKPAPLSIHEVLKLAELEFTKHDSGHLEIKVKEKKKAEKKDGADEKDEAEQSVFVTKDIEYYERADVRKIWSLAMTSNKQPDVATMTKLLQQSAQTKMGGWMLERTQQGDYMIIYCVKLDATASPAAVKSTVDYVAKLTTMMKKELAPKSGEETSGGTQTLDSWLSK